ncbi:hypothetical protein GPJ56_003551 [Histomonas meleagridis]|uniref:uncharacterized protein n=1 Tax=Histomonas meleagridis TaxID=135588 RepID=UPI00355A91CA|nr:hypothetical protein GPJ56_003551 [Histomonas meleagridis]KAH0806437.1 hypothetical protein GO595_000812 [Histomonas meleagridis]
MKLPLKPFLFFYSFIVFGFIAIAVFRGHSKPGDIYVDRHGESWRIPSDGAITSVSDWLISSIPRFTRKFSLINPDFDLENDDYLDSSVMYILLFSVLGVLLLLIYILILIFRYCCNCCGGKQLPRRGFSQTVVNSARIGIIVFTFLFEGILIYGYFANTDFHVSLRKVFDVFDQVPTKLEENMTQFISTLPQTTSNSLYNKFRNEFEQDLRFSVRYAKGQSQIMGNLINKFEDARMAVILINLILATVSCSFGIVAGSIYRGCFMIIMVVLNAIACVFFFVSTGIHFAGSKIIYEYCDEISFYIDDSTVENIPMRLQFFVPCVNSPLYPVFEDHYVILAVNSVNEFNDKMVEYYPITNASKAYWFNITDPYYQQISANRTDLNALYAQAKNKSTNLANLESMKQCEFSKNEMRGEKFLFCSYMKDNLDMLMLSQFVGCILIIIITSIGVSAIKKFEWAGNAGLGGIAASAATKKKTKPRAKRRAT